MRHRDQAARGTPRARTKCSQKNRTRREVSATRTKTCFWCGGWKDLHERSLKSEAEQGKSKPPRRHLSPSAKKTTQQRQQATSFVNSAHLKECMCHCIRCQPHAFVNSKGAPSKQKTECTLATHPQHCTPSSQKNKVCFINTCHNTAPLARAARFARDSLWVRQKPVNTVQLLLMSPTHSDGRPRPSLEALKLMRCAKKKEEQDWARDLPPLPVAQKNSTSVAVEESHCSKCGSPHENVDPLMLLRTAGRRWNRQLHVRHRCCGCHSECH